MTHDHTEVNSSSRIFFFFMRSHSPEDLRWISSENLLINIWWRFCIQIFLRSSEVRKKNSKWVILNIAYTNSSFLYITRFFRRFKKDFHVWFHWIWVLDFSHPRRFFILTWECLFHQSIIKSASRFKTSLFWSEWIT